jgi:flagellar biosynthesis chaperone FliJ
MMKRPSLIRSLLIAPLALGMLTLTADAAPVHHSHVQHALHELREARHELKGARHDFGGHRVAALKATDDAIHQLDKLVAHPHHKHHAAQSKYKVSQHKHVSHIHHALHELKEARHELRESKHDFGGIKERALLDMNFAIEQLELVVRHHRK